LWHVIGAQPELFTFFYIADASLKGDPEPKVVLLVSPVNGPHAVEWE